jgi:hypothetical protein
MRAALTDGIRRTLGSAVSKRQRQQHLQHQLCSSSSDSSGSIKRRPQSATTARTAAAQRHSATTTAASNTTATSDGGSSSKQWASRTGPARLHNLVSMVAEVLALYGYIVYALLDTHAVVITAAMWCWVSACT